jgi:hypothetical protein
MVLHHRGCGFDHCVGLFHKIMKEKTKELLSNLKKISTKEVTSVSSWLEGAQVESNRPTGKWIDRIYGMAGASTEVELINKNNTDYRGKIHRRRITEQSLDGSNFFSHVYETADGRWFDRTGFPMDKPATLEKEPTDDTSEQGPTVEVA